MKLSSIRKITQNLPIPEKRTPQDWQKLGFDPGTLYQELEMDSRYVDTHRDTSWSNANVHLHSHTFFEILFCRNTCGVEYLIGADRYRLQKGDIVVVPPGVSHRPLLPEHMTEPYVRDVLWISQEFVTFMMQTFPEEELYRQTDTRLLRTAGTKWEFLGEMFHRGVEEAERQDLGWDAVLMGNTIQLVAHLRRAIIQRTAHPLTAEKPDLLNQVLAYIEENLSRRLTLPEVARHFYVSESTISQTFRQKMGVSFHQCVTQRRLIAAKELILEGMLLENVGEQVGFSDYSSFYRAFRQEYGISPRQFRKLQEPGEWAL